MRLLPLVSPSYAPTCWPFFSLLGMFHPPYSCTQPQVGLSLFYYNYCPVSPGFCSPIIPLRIIVLLLSTGHSLSEDYYSHPSYLVYSSNQSGFKPSLQPTNIYIISLGIEKYCLALITVLYDIMIVTTLTLFTPVTSLDLHHPLNQKISTIHCLNQ